MTIQTNAQSHALFMTEETGKAWVEAGRAETSARVKFTKFADLAFAEGYRKENFISPKTEGSRNTEESWEDVLSWAGKAYLTAAERKLLDTPAKSLSAEKAKEKREARQKLGTRIRDVKNAFKRREQAEAKAQGGEEGKAEKAPKPGKTPEARIIDGINTVLKIMRETDDLAFRPDVPAEHIRKALAFIVNAGK